MKWIVAKKYLTSFCLFLYRVRKSAIPLLKLGSVTDLFHARRRLFKDCSTRVFPALISRSECSMLVRNSRLKSPSAPARRSNWSTLTSTRALLRSGLNVTVRVVMTVWYHVHILFANRAFSPTRTVTVLRLDSPQLGYRGRL